MSICEDHPERYEVLRDQVPFFRILTVLERRMRDSEEEKRRHDETMRKMKRKGKQ